MTASAIIPARYASSRFPGKPLAQISGLPMIQHVYQAVSRSRLLDEVIVATDDERILEVVRGFGGKAVMTSPLHTTGSERVAEVARKLRSEVIVNVQGDEPLIRASILDKAIRPVQKDESIQMCTLMTRITEARNWLNPHIVKVVADREGNALYFSRSPIPFPRNLNVEKLLSAPAGRIEALPRPLYKHIGVYVFRRKFLLQYSKMKPTPLEKLEKLEQLRVLENGFRIKVVAVDYEPVCVDTPQDLEKVRMLVSGRTSK
jgi:3-deoxy-manno-octulosonate cytidylyltransferase (CMP-KDO synthetase)